MVRILGYVSTIKKKDAFVGVNLYNDNIIEDGERLIYSIISDDNGFLWIGTYDGGLIKFSPSSGILKRYKNDPKNPNSICSNLVFSLLIDSYKRLWVGTNKGLAEYKPSTDEFAIYRYDVNNRKGISSDRITSLFQDVSGKLWIGTSDGGINIFDTEKKRL